MARFPLSHEKLKPFGRLMWNFSQKKRLWHQKRVPLVFIGMSGIQRNAL
jgi:hypothetical protein